MGYLINLLIIDLCNLRFNIKLDIILKIILKNFLGFERMGVIWCDFRDVWVFI